MFLVGLLPVIYQFATCNLLRIRILISFETHKIFLCSTMSVYCLYVVLSGLGKCRIKKEIKENRILTITEFEMSKNEGKYGIFAGK